MIFPYFMFKKSMGYEIQVSPGSISLFVFLEQKKFTVFCSWLFFDIGNSLIIGKIF